jgi:hypothetical protein
MGWLVGKDEERLGSVFSGFDVFGADFAKHFGDERPDERLVVDDEDFVGR